MRADPAVLAVTHEALPREPAAAIPGGRLAIRASALLGRRVHVRRIQEAVRTLRLRGVPVVSGCGKDKGYRIATSAEAIKDCVEEHRRRALSELHAMAKLKGCTVQEAQRTLFDFRLLS